MRPEKTTGVLFDKRSSFQSAKDFFDLSEAELRAKYKLPEDVRDWKYGWAKEDLKKSGLSEDKVKDILYRPFDSMKIYYTGNSRGYIGWPVVEVMQHMKKGNIGLATVRQGKASDTWCHALVSDSMIESTLVSNRTSEITYLFPLWSHEKDKAKSINFSDSFNSFIQSLYKTRFTPEQILGYIYGILYTPAYRKKYAEFLKSDFPRIPFAKKEKDFEAISALGWELVQAHLKDDVPSVFTKPILGRQHIGEFMVTASDVIEKPSFELYAKQPAVKDDTGILRKLGKAFINKSQYFDLVPLEAWEFQIGGYQPLQKWLKDRKDRKLTGGEKNHYESMVRTICFTIHIMNQLDAQWKKSM